MSETSGSVRQQIGEILGTVRSLAEQMKERQADAREEAKGLRSEIGNVKHEQRAELQIISLRMEKQEKETQKLAEEQRAIALQMITLNHDVALQTTALNQAVANLKAPVDELLNIKRRSVAFFALAASVIGVMWAVVQMVWPWIAQRWLGFKG